MGRSEAEYERIVTAAFGAAARPVALSVKELAVLTSLVDRLLPDRPPFPTAREVGVALRIDRELSFHGAKLTSDTSAALFLLEHGGVLHGGVRPFTELSTEAQDERLIAMAGGNDIERQVVNGLRILALFFFYADERTWKHIGYDGPLVAERTPHPAGGARMGGDARTSVVNSDGRMWSTAALYVADPSAFPTVVSVDPSESIMAWSYVTAARILSTS